MKKRLLIFDFDGTIANTLVIACRILNEVGGDYLLPEVKEEMIAEMKGKSIRELMRLGGLRWWQLPGFLKKARRLFKQYMEDVPPITGMPEIIRQLQGKGYRMGILTSNSEEAVRSFLDHHELEGFDFVLAPDSLFGKANVIKKILKYGKFEKESVMMIGDEVRDIDAAHKAGIDSMAVSWGFNSIELLESSAPTHLVHSPEELIGQVLSMEATS